MKIGLRPFLLLSLFGGVACLVFSGVAAPQEPNLDKLAKQLGKEVSKAKLKSVVVVDFLTSDGSASNRGQYLADQFSDNWIGHRQGFRILERSKDVRTNLSSEDLSFTESVQRIGRAWGVDAIVSGTLDDLSDNYVLTLTLRRVADAAVLATVSQPIPHSCYLHLLGPKGLETGGAGPNHAGLNGVTVPVCIHCPAPNYSNQGRKGHYQGTVILGVVISSSGRTEKIIVVKDLGVGLTEKAIAAVSEWRFRPAKNKDGNSVPVIVPIEVTFRLSDNE